MNGQRTEVMLGRITMSPLSLALCSLLTTATIAACSDSNEGRADASPDATPIDCSLLTYENFGRAFVEEYCLECHHSSLTGLSRQNAPISIDFDDYQRVFGFAISIKAIAGSRPLMPPSFAMAIPSAEERVQLVQWIECGLP